MIDDGQIERNKLAAERGWLADPPRTAALAYPEERAAQAEAGRRRYAPLANQRDNWIAFLRRYEDKG